MRRLWWTGFFILVFLFVAVSIDGSAPRRLVVRLDIINGREHIVEKLFGFSFKDEVLDTAFSRLVVQNGLEAKPEWVVTVVNGRGFFGGFRMCGYPPHGHLAGDYREFAEVVYPHSAEVVYPHSALDSPTTMILEIRRLAKVNKGRDVQELIDEISRQDNWPAK